MAAKIQTLPGHAVPPAPRHAITLHYPGWEAVLQVRDAHLHPGLLDRFKSMYPRVKIHDDVKALAGRILEKAGQDLENPQNCLLFASAEAAAECKAFAIDARRGEAALRGDEIAIRVFDVDVRFYAVFIPVPKTRALMAFWTNAGVGISSRLAEESLKHIELLQEVMDDTLPPYVRLSPVHGLIQERIAALLERAPVGPLRTKKVQQDDVYLFQSGMAAIYGVHKYLLSEWDGLTAVFGYTFNSTINVFEDFGPGCKTFGRGDAEDLIALEAYLEAEAKEGRGVRLVWTEFPANPILTSADLSRLRQLADKYQFVLVADDTVGSFCNVDLLGAVDIVVTSLTKSFSGYSDVLGGSAVLNPLSPMYFSLKALFQALHTNNLFNGDVEVLEQNSRDYLARSTTLNNNALRLVEYLQTLALNPESSVARIHYPTVNPSLPNYQRYMRTATDEFTPGYGCLFSVEFGSITATAAFVDNLNLHQGPHLGANVTLVLPYVMMLYGNQLDSVVEYGLKETQVRISVGLEDPEILLEEFRIAIAAADKAEAVKRGQQDGAVVVVA